MSFVRSAYLALNLRVLTAIGAAGFLVIYLTLVQEVNPLHVGAAAGMLGAGNMAYALLSRLSAGWRQEPRRRAHLEKTRWLDPEQALETL